ncbi:hypothetical protein AZE42_10882 [Rhizopogon vesiculosus]|uniref:Uncharacterized protein n=1 Tax=Rhizopogon vesiculosus TaxID=180088 RepID=A0A1J8QX60_9AGAM|nr:hypothetical protein AZE42_10882 [Rhizopogon vesiculosus]
MAPLEWLKEHREAEDV